MIDLVVMDLPQPDSPTRAMHWPGRTSNETWSTTLTSPCEGKLMQRFLTERMGLTVRSGTWRSVRASSTFLRAPSLRSRDAACSL